MAKILISTIISNDLGPIMRMLPIANILRDSSHEVIFCNRSWAPIKIIKENNFQNYSTIEPNHSPKVWPEVITPEIWNGNQGMAYEGFLDLEYVRDLVSTYIKLLDEVKPDIVVDTWNQASCTAAKAKHIPLVTINQADLHPEGNGLIWWKEPPDDLPNPIPVVNQVLSELNLPLIKKKVEELFLGDLVLVVGTPETDPLPKTAKVTYIGSLQKISRNDELPESIQNYPKDKPLIWVYSGNPRYGSNPSFTDSIVIIRASISVLGKEDVRVVLSTGYQPLPEEFVKLPSNFQFEKFIPGFAMAKRADLFVHHGGHGSYLTGLSAGTPAIIIPTFSERESNARRVAQLGAGLFVLPFERKDGEKDVSLDEFRDKVKLVLSDKSYKKNAQSVAQKMSRYSGPELAAQLILDFMKKNIV
jgi:hypothetical protein